MDTKDRSHFFDALGLVATVMCDEMSEARTEAYFALFRDRCLLDEWQYACHQVLMEETFHKVPLPAIFMEHIRARKAEKAKEECDKIKRLEAEKQAECLTDGNLLDMRKQVAHLIASVGGNMEPENKPDRPVHPAYVVSLDQERAMKRKAELLEQARKIQAETTKEN